MNLFKMAWRNVWRNGRRSAVTIAAMTLALTVEVLYSGLIVGMMEGMEEDVIDLELGDIQIHADGYLSNPSLFTWIEEPGPLIAKLDSAGYAASPRLKGGGLAASGDLSAGVVLTGLDVARDAAVSSIGQHVERGQWLDPSDPNGVVIGRRLARSLAAEPGSELVVLTQAADGSMANDLYTVRGVLSSVAAGTDRSAVYLTEDAFRELMVLPDGVHQIVIRRPYDVPLEDAAAAVTAMADDDLDVKSWKQLMPMIAMMLEQTSGVVVIVYFMVYVAVAILILNAMLMAVFERIREFGVLKAIGVTPLQVFGMILIESMIQAVIAMGLGMAVAAPCMWYLSTVGIDVGALAGTEMMGMSMRPVWHGVYRPESFGVPIVMLYVIVLVAVVYPAMKAAWIRPVEAMRHQ